MVILSGYGVEITINKLCFTLTGWIYLDHHQLFLTVKYTTFIKNKIRLLKNQFLIISND